MSKLLSSKRSLIGLDVGDDGVKLVQLQRNGKVTSIAASGHRRFRDGGSVDPERRREQAVEAVRGLLAEKGFRGRRAVASLPCRQIGIKNVRLPQMPMEELRQAAAWEAGERLGYQESEDELRVLKAGEVRSGTEIHDEVILLTVPRKTIEDHLAMLGEMGVRAESIDPEPLALFRCFERIRRRQSDEQDVSIMVDLGVGGTRVVVARGREVAFVKNIDVGGRRFNQAVAGHLNLTYAEAADLRVKMMREHAEAAEHADAEAKTDPPAEAPHDGSWTLHDAVRAPAEELGREISLCLRYCAVTFRGLRPERISLTGGEAYDPMLVELLAEQLGIPCEVGQPMRGIDTSAAPDTSRRGALCEWAVPVGLALRNFDTAKIADREDHAERRLSA